MPKLKNTFHLGTMDKETDRALVQNGRTRHVENMRFHTNDGNDAIGVSIKGMSIVSDETAGSGDLKCVGAYFDEDKDAIYYYLASTDGVISKIVEYSVKNDDTTIIAEDSQSVLKFDKTGFITGINEVNGLLIFSEWGNNPRRVNIERAKEYGLNGFTEDDITVIVKPPEQKLSVTLETSTTITAEENFIIEKMLAFSYRWRYLDGEYSALAPFTEFAFEPKPWKYNYQEQSNESMVNKFNQISIEFGTGNERVTEIQLIFKESESLTEWIIDDFDKALLGYGDDQTQTFKFNNLKNIRALSKHVNRVNYDNVPRTSKAQTMIGNRVMYAHYKEDYDLQDDIQAQIKIDFSLLLIDLANTIEVEGDDVPSLIPKRTVKSNRDYEIVIVYQDEYGRQSTSLTSKENTIQIPNSKSITENSIDVILKNKPPYWATKFRFFIKQSKKGYDQLLPNLFYEDSVFVWIKLEGSNIDKVKEGDFLIVKSGSQGVLEPLIKTKVLEVKTQEKNFLQPDDVTDEIVERSGRYFKIKPKGYRIDIDDFDSYLLETYDNSSNAYDNPVRSLAPYIGAPNFYGDTLDDLISAGAYSGATGSRTRFLIKIDGLQAPATGTVNLDSGGSGSVDSVTVNAIEILSASVPFNTDLSITATDVASNITANSSTPNYTAVAVGTLITITAVDQGVTPNGFVVVSTATTIATTDVNLSGGTENTFKWSVNDGGDWLAEDVEITAGAPQTLNDDVTITFTNDTGHSLLDEWNINARATFSVNGGSKAYGFFRTENLHDEILENVSDEIINIGARIFLEYDEYDEGDDFFTLDETSNDRYNNIEEWFWKEDIISKISPQGNITLANVFFVRGVLHYDDSATQITQDDVNGTMTLLIQSHATQNSDADHKPKVRCISEILQSNTNNILLFETEPKDQPYETFYEIGKTYDIVNGYHISDNPNIPTDVNQANGVNLRVKLDWFNAFSYGNGVESYKIKDEVISKGLDMGVRVSAVSDTGFKEITRIADVTWSDVYEDETGFNGLNSFNLSLANFVKLDRENGSIQKLHNSNQNLMVLQEDAIGLMPYNKNIIYDTEGGRFVGITTNILNKESYTKYKGIHGISKEPESFVSVANQNFFSDKMRGDIIRLSTDGVTDINKYMLDHFTSNEMIANKNNPLVGGYDPKHKEYILHSPNLSKCLIFKDSALGFPQFMTFEPDVMVYGNNEVYSWKNGVMYKHHASATRNLFYGVSYPTKVQYFANGGREFSVEKIANAISIEGTHPCIVNISTPLTGRTIPKESFEKIESNWYSEIMGNTNDEPLSNSRYGLGTYAIVNGEILTSKKVTSLSIGDYIVSNTLPFTKEKITDVLSDRIVLENAINEVSSFLMYEKDADVDGESIRGDVFDVEMIFNETEKVELRAVNIEVIESELS